MLAFAPSRLAGVREIESLDLCLFLNVPLPIRRPGWWCLPVVLTVQMLVCGCGGVSRRLDQKSAKSPPRCGKSTVMFFGMVCLQHPRPGRVAFFFFFLMVITCLFEFLTASNDFRWASVVWSGVGRACTLHTCIGRRACVSTSGGVPNGANFPRLNVKEKIARASLRHRC